MALARGMMATMRAPRALVLLALLGTACEDQPALPGSVRLDAAAPGAEAGAAATDTAAEEAGLSVADAPPAEEAGTPVADAAPADVAAGVDAGARDLDDGDGGCGQGPSQALDAGTSHPGFMAIAADGETVATSLSEINSFPRQRILVWSRRGGAPPISLSPAGELLGFRFRADGVLVTLEGREAEGKQAVVLRRPPGFDVAGEWTAPWIPTSSYPRGELAVAPDGKTVVLAGGSIDLRRIEDGTIVLSLPQPAARVDFAPDGTRLASVSGELKVWRLPDGQPMALPPALQSFRAGWVSLSADLTGVDFAPELRRLSDGSLLAQPPASALYPNARWDAPRAASTSGRFVIWRMFGGVSWAHPHFLFDRKNNTATRIGDHMVEAGPGYGIVLSPDERFAVFNGFQTFCLPR